MAKPLKPIKAFKHGGNKRAHIPSAEEAGYETGNPKVRSEQTPRDFLRNPVVHRGQDPELFWLNKYGESDGGTTDVSRVDIRSLYRSEHVAPETIIKGLYRMTATESAAGPDLTGFNVPELFGNAIGHEELDKVHDYYQWTDGWTNRLIQGDSLVTMTSLLEREGMAGQVQCIYIDPPYGIKYGSNWQIRLNNRSVTDGQDDSLSGEPEQIKAFRDTWELGIHSYLSYLRDRLLVAKELMHESGSCFVQISDENVHLVRCLMDEVFGSANSVVTIVVKKKSTTTPTDPINDFIIWYAKDRESVRKKIRKLYIKKSRPENDPKFNTLISTSGEMVRVKSLTDVEIEEKMIQGWRWARVNYPLVSQDPSSRSEDVTWKGKIFRCGRNRHWTYGPQGTLKLAESGRAFDGGGESLGAVVFWDDWPYILRANLWDDVHGESDPIYVVQTTHKIVERCILMTTDPGDLVLDPTCGSGTTAFVAEQWGRRWITIDTSRIALNIAKTRLTTATFPYYLLADQATCDLRLGFQYKKVPHITLGSIANGEPPNEETLYDQPLEDKKRLRVAGAFTVETLQSYEPISPEELARQRDSDRDLSNFEELIFAHLQSAGIKTGDRAENAVFTRVDRLADTALHAEGWYGTASGEKKAYLHIGPKFGTVSKQAVGEAIKACRDRRDGDWLLILGFAFESGITELSRSFGSFQVSIVRMHDDLLQQGLLKKDKKAASFVTIGEPDIRWQRVPNTATATVEIAGLDIYDPIKDEVKSRDVQDIHYWMLDDHYDGSNFVVRQVFFCGGDKDEFSDWKKGLTRLAEAATRKKAEQTLKLQIDEEAFASLYGHVSRPFTVQPGQKIAVRVVSQFGEETTKVLAVT